MPNDTADLAFLVDDVEDEVFEKTSTRMVVDANFSGASTPLWPSDAVDVGKDDDADGDGYNWPVLFLSTIVILAIGGNVLVCLAVRYEVKLRNMFNYFLVSLALSDMLSAILVMPLSIIKTLIGKRRPSI